MIKQKIKKILFMADIHWGCQNPLAMFNQINAPVINIVREEEIDIVFIAGDYFHSKLSLNSEASILAITFLNNLLRECEERGTHVIIISGTRTHDFNQLDVFKSIHSDFLHICTTKTIIKGRFGLNMALIPEEYIPEDKQEEYYSAVYEGGFDIIVGHGMFDFQSFEVKNQESERVIQNAPVFDSERFDKLTKYGTYFGHIHKPCQKKSVHYIGSFSTLNHGEVGQKSMILLEIDQNNNTHEIYRINNENDFEFKDIKMSDLLTVYKNDMEQVSSKIKEYAKDKFVRIIVDSEIDPTYNNILKKISVENDSISIKFKKKEIEKRVPDEYNFLLDNKIDYDSKIKTFIKIKNGYDIPEEILEKVKKKLNNK